MPYLHEKHIFSPNWLFSSCFFPFLKLEWSFFPVIKMKKNNQKKSIGVKNVFFMQLKHQFNWLKQFGKSEKNFRSFLAFPRVPQPTPISRLRGNSKVPSVTRNKLPWGLTMHNLRHLSCSVWAQGGVGRKFGCTSYIRRKLVYFITSMFFSRF